MVSISSDSVFLLPVFLVSLLTYLDQNLPKMFTLSSKKERDGRRLQRLDPASGADEQEGVSGTEANSRPFFESEIKEIIELDEESPA
jgi:hypothetical protein